MGFLSMGEKIVAEAWRAFELWCAAYDPEGDLGIEEQVRRYSTWCDAGNRIVLPPQEKTDA